MTTWLPFDDDGFDAREKIAILWKVDGWENVFTWYTCWILREDG